jgi:hypothetical protein
MQATNPRTESKNLKEDTFMIYNVLMKKGSFIPCQFYNRFRGKIILFELLFLKKVNPKGQKH